MKNYVDIIIAKYPGIKPRRLPFPESDGNFLLAELPPLDENGLPIPGDPVVTIIFWDWPEPQPTIVELDDYALTQEYQNYLDVIASDEQQAETERLDLADLGQQAANEIGYLETDIAYIQTVIPLIDSMTTAQVRTVARELAERVLRLEQENLTIIKALRYVVRKLPERAGERQP